MMPASMLRSHSRWVVAPIVVLLALLLVSAAAAQADFGEPVPGQRVYDRAGALSPEQIAGLEQQAAAVAEAGAPAVVYLRAHDSNYDDTVKDARALMDAWDIQSAPAARDGFVIFFNLEPGNLEHGDYALIAGAALINGSVPQYELDRIADDMQPLLADGDIAGATGFALARVESDLRDGPPPPPEPSAVEQFADDVAGGAVSILNIIAVAVAGVAAWLIARAMPRRRKSNAPVVPATFPPDSLPPALAGALVTNGVSDSDIAATILDMAARGALKVEPDGKKKVRIRLIDESLVWPGYEEGIWQAFAQRADANGIVADKQLDQSRKDWGQIREVIRQDLIGRGWFDPDAGKRSTPFYLAAAGLGVLAIVALIVGVIADSFWAIPAIAVLVIAAVFALIAAYEVPVTTPEGDEVAAPWRGYQRYLKTAGKNPQVALDLDTALPYAVGLGASGSLDKRLKAASADGYLPAWLGGSQAADAGASGFYPYWIAFNSSVAPTSTSTSTSSGASAGSGASGGSF